MLWITKEAVAAPCFATPLLVQRLAMTEPPKPKLF